MGVTSLLECLTICKVLQIMCLQYCAECGNPMVKLPVGCYLKCCNGLGYWYRGSPKPYMKIKSYKGFYLYLNLSKWPNGVKAVKPINI